MQQHAGPQQQVVGEKRSRIGGSAAVTGGSRGCSDAVACGAVACRAAATMLCFFIFTSSVFGLS